MQTGLHQRHACELSLCANALVLLEGDQSPSPQPSPWSGRGGKTNSRQSWRNSREALEFGKIGAALLQEGVAAFLGFLGQIVKQGRVAGQLLDSRQTVGVGVERRLQEANRGRAL